MVWQAMSLVLITGVLLVTGVTAAAWSAVRAWRRGRAAREDAPPSCGRCGYIVHPGSRRVCPECGSDFGDVGIVTAATAPPGYPFLVLWILGVGATLFAWWAGPALAAATPWGWDFHAAHVIQTSRSRWVPNMHEGAFCVTARGVGRGWGSRVTQLNVTYMIPGAYWITLDVEGGGDACVIRTRPRPIGPMPLDDAVGRFVEEAGFDPSSPEAVSLRGTVRAKARALLANDLPQESGRQSGDWQGRTVFDSIQFWPNDYAGWVAGALVWFATFGVAVVALGRWQRRRRQARIRQGRHLTAALGLA